MENQEKLKTVPYLSTSKMEKVLELVSERSLSNITPEYFKTYNFGGADAYLAVNALKFLGLLDDNGKATEKAKKFQLRGEARDKEAEIVVRDAYNKLFEATSKPYELSKDDLVNEFMHKYDLSKRIASSAVPAFLKLCEFAGLVEMGSVPTRKRTGGTEKVRISKKESRGAKQDVSSNDYGQNTPIPFADGKIKLILPTETLIKTSFDDVLDRDWKALVKTLTEFSDKHITKNNSSNEESENDDK